MQCFDSRVLGGQHEAAGTCQVPNDEAESVLLELIDQLRDNSLEGDLAIAAAASTSS
jgi:hypothetical protein